MNLLALPAAALSAVGRHGTLFVAASIFVGLFVPGAAALAKPWLGETILVMLTLGFLRVDPVELRAHWTNPKLILAATAWTMLVAPAILGLVFLFSGLKQSDPGLYFILVLQMCAPGLTSSAALAALLGLDVALTLATLVIATAIVPLTASFFTYVFIGAVVITPVKLGVHLFLIIAGCAVAAVVIRRIAGTPWLERQREGLDGLSVLAMFMFAVAAMDSVRDNFVADPWLIVRLTILTFALALGTMAITALVFWRAGRWRAFSIGLNAGNRNLGLILTATGFAIPEIAWIYFGLAQFPIYLLPHLLKPLAKRLEQAKR